MTPTKEIPCSVCGGLKYDPILRFRECRFCAGKGNVKVVIPEDELAELASGEVRLSAVSG